MRRAQVTVYLDDAPAAALDAQARRGGISRSACAARIIAHHFVRVDDGAELRYPAFAVRALVRQLSGDALVAAIDADFDAVNGPGAVARILGTA